MLRDTEIQTYWPRQVACLALEVSTHRNHCALLTQAKRIKVPKTIDPLPPDPSLLSRIAFPEKNFIGQIVAEMLTMVCHRRLLGIDQEVHLLCCSVLTFRHL